MCTIYIAHHQNIVAPGTTSSLLFPHIPTTSAPTPNTYYPRLHSLHILLHPISTTHAYTHYLRAYTPSLVYPHIPTTPYAYTPSLVFLHVPTTSAPTPNTYYSRLHSLPPRLHPIPTTHAYTHYLRAYTQYLLPTPTPTTSTHTTHTSSQSRCQHTVLPNCAFPRILHSPTP